jgi:hypothetical protein
LRVLFWNKVERLQAADDFNDIACWWWLLVWSCSLQYHESGESISIFHMDVCFGSI